MRKKNRSHSTKIYMKSKKYLPCLICGHRISWSVAIADSKGLKSFTLFFHAVTYSQTILANNAFEFKLYGKIATNFSSKSSTSFSFDFIGLASQLGSTVGAIPSCTPSNDFLEDILSFVTTIKSFCNKNSGSKPIPASHLATNSDIAPSKKE